MSELLRQYEKRVCVYDTPTPALENGYPWAWSHGETPIKHLIREEAQHRCERCWHPFVVGETPGEWSPCDDKCKHTGPYRVRETMREDEWKVFYGTGLPFPGEAMYEFGPDGRELQRWKYEAHWRVLTVHHLDEDKGNCRWWNLVALCQRCHLRMQKAVIMDRPYHFEHSVWFQPYAAAFYAFKYLGEDLSRQETMERLDELLALEHRFTQESLLP